MPTVWTPSSAAPRQILVAISPRFPAITFLKGATSTVTLPEVIDGFKVPTCDATLRRWFFGHSTLLAVQEAVAESDLKQILVFL
jgi:hypothetical protein